MTLEDAIREAADSGRLSGLTLWLNAKGEWEAGMRSRKNWRDDKTGKSVGWKVEVHDDDPVAALRAVFNLPTEPTGGLFD